MLFGVLWLFSCAAALANVKGHLPFRNNISDNEPSFNQWAMVNAERIKLEKLQAEIAARMYSYRPLPFFMISIVLCTLVILIAVILVQASNIEKSNYNSRKSQERFQKLWEQETTKNEASSCVADIDFTYANARPGLICRLFSANSVKQDRPVAGKSTRDTAGKNPVTTVGAVKRIPRWVIGIEIISSGVLLLQLICMGLCVYHIDDSVEMIERFCTEDLASCQQNCFFGQLSGKLRSTVYQLHAEVRNAFGVYISHLADARTNFDYTLIMIYMTCIFTCSYIFSSLCSTFVHCKEIDSNGKAFLLRCNVIVQLICFSILQPSL
ncbi:hypothetical protein Tcan_03059 [Toxocara canis]|uniref:Uncharacterized protein n=1 Tax=Toxocara canis TaxID=6265 RepID=A0A0B2VD42_TOXCA|nr:hypothetical protein Tcan_03059 [Toxocara canis]